jgi:hypothetical protein
MKFSSPASKYDNNNNNKTRNILRNVTKRRVRVTIVVVEKQCVTCSECVFVALGIQHKMRMWYIFICGLSCCSPFFRSINCTIQEDEEEDVGTCWMTLRKGMVPSSEGGSTTSHCVESLLCKRI